MLYGLKASMSSNQLDIFVIPSKNNGIDFKEMNGFHKGTWSLPSGEVRHYYTSPKGLVVMKDMNFNDPITTEELEESLKNKDVIFYTPGYLKYQLEEAKSKAKYKKAKDELYKIFCELKPTPTEHELKLYEKLFIHDWYYDFSDDGDVWRRGSAAQKVLEKEFSDASMTPLIAAYKKYMIG